jgi:hypothetical protein
MMPSFTILPSMTGQDIITIALGTSEEEPQEE